MSRDRQIQLFGGDWTERKLAILTGYLAAYNKALKKQKFRRVYVDAFAGTGYRQQVRRDMGGVDIFEELKEAKAQEFLKGSAKRALEVDPPFDGYVFVESDVEKVGELRLLKAEHPGSDIEIVQGDANEYVQGFCKGMLPETRAVVFMDPFATQVQWATVEAVAATKAIDVWILFPLMAVNRLLANDPRKICRPALDRLFGTGEWFERFYRTRTENDIFGQSFETVRKACDFGRVGDFYRERLSEVFAGVASGPCIFENSQKSPLFQLFFAAGNAKGAPIAVRIANYLLENM